MVISLRENGYFLRYLALILLAVMVFPCFSRASSTSTSHTVEDTKKAILDDPLFLNHLRDRLSVESIAQDGIRTVIRNYLLENPQILFEMQEVLNKMNAEQIEKDEKTREQVIRDAAPALFHASGDAVFGNPDGDITVVEFYDYNCGYCKKSFPVLQKLVREDRKVRLVMKDYPILGPGSAQAHLVAQAFRSLMPAKYLLFHEKLMTYKGRATEESAMEIARSLGGDEKKLRKAMRGSDLKETLEKNADIAYRLGINYTPAYIVGTRFVPGAVKEEALVAIIAEERKKEK